MKRLAGISLALVYGLLLPGCLELASRNVTQTISAAPANSSPIAAPQDDTPYTGPVLAPGATVSAWLGVNVDSDFPWNDLRYQLTGFNPAPGGSLDQDGYPVAGTSATSSSDIGETIPTGVYNVSYEGTGTVTFSGIASQVAPWTVIGGEHRTKVQVTGTPQKYPSMLNLTITNQPGQTVSNIHFYLPGVDYDSAELFNPKFLAALAPFRQLRMMGWLATNGSALEYWTQRPTMSHFGSNPLGIPYEFIVALANETGKDLWINIPELANNDFLSELAQFLATNLDFDRIAAARQAQGLRAPFRILLEYSNETWNNGAGFTAYGTLLAEAHMNLARYTGAYMGTSPDWVSQNIDIMRVAQIEADMDVNIGTIFRNVFSQIGKRDTIEIVLGGWAIAANYSYEALDFISKQYPGPVSNYVNYISLAPYFGGDDSDPLDIGSFFSTVTANIDSFKSNFQSFKNLSDQFHVQVAAYESGTGDVSGNNGAIIHLAMHDVRMHDAYIQYYNLWKHYFGESRMNQFVLSGGFIPEVFYEYGYWGSLESIQLDLAHCGLNLPTLTGTEPIASVIDNCPKYQAMLEQVGN